MSNIFITSDTHFGHTNIIKYCGRPFQTKQEHDEALIERWNSVVSPGQTVYHLGDFGFGDPIYLKRISQKLHGRIAFLKGNHDKSQTLDKIGERFLFVKDTHLLTTKVKGKTQRIFLSHYAHRSWPMSNHGSWHLFGHSHGNMPPHGLSFDVGVDCWNFTPISIEQIYDKIQTLKMELDYTKES